MNELEPIPDTVPQFPISFGGELAGEESAVTRADQTLGQDFFLYGYKTLADNSRPAVFPKYTVYFGPGTAGSTEDNTHNYYYVKPENNQFIKYWDYSASEYRFWGYIPHKSMYPDDDDDFISPSNGGQTLTIKGLAISIKEPQNYLVSMPNVVPNTEFGNTVQMRFVHPYAKVRVMIYSGEKLVSSDKVRLSDISFGPEDPSKKIVSAETIQIDYPLSGSTEEKYSILINPSTPYKDKFSYQDLDLTSDHCTSNTAAAAIPDEADATTADQYYYVLPTGTGVAAPDFKLSMTFNNETRTAIVPAVYMHWNPNYSYTYIFKVLDGTLLFVDVKVTDWQNGGSANDTWTNW